MSVTYHECHINLLITPQFLSKFGFRQKDDIADSQDPRSFMQDKWRAGPPWPKTIRKAILWTQVALMQFLEQPSYSLAILSSQKSCERSNLICHLVQSHMEIRLKGEKAV